MLLSSADNRQLTNEEFDLAKFMLEASGKSAAPFIRQLDSAQALSTKCPCGCASFDLLINGENSDRSIGISVIGDFTFDSKNEKYGAFIFECEGRLAGVEVYGLTGDAPKFLPKPKDLKKC